jgi:phage host-nuclease inhibitor protein Gam
MNEVVGPLSENLAALKQIRTSLPKGSEEEKKISSEIKELEGKLANYEEAKQRDELVELMKFSSTNFIPLIIMGEH